jgi:ABC-2 type transport system permease protein
VNATAILTTRILDASRLDLAFAVMAPTIGLIGVTLLLDGVIATGTMSYVQYVLPAIVVQAMLFGALTTTDRAADEKASGFGGRLRTLPIPPYASLAARMVYCVIRGAVAVVATVLTAYLFGFRLNTGFGYGAAFFAMALILTLGLSLGADVVGSKAGRTEMASQLLMVPQLLLVLLSTGLAPAEAFPGWLQPVVRYQPVSQITETLRGFLSGQVATGNVLMSAAWCAALLIGFGALAVRTQRTRA